MSLYCIAEIISTVPRWFVFYSLCKLTHVVAIFSEKKKTKYNGRNNGVYYQLAGNKICVSALKQCHLFTLTVIRFYCKLVYSYYFNLKYNYGLYLKKYYCEILSYK